MPNDLTKQAFMQACKRNKFIPDHPVHMGYFTLPNGRVADVRKVHEDRTKRTRRKILQYLTKESRRE